MKDTTRKKKTFIGSLCALCAFPLLLFCACRLGEPTAITPAHSPVPTVTDTPSAETDVEKEEQKQEETDGEEQGEKTVEEEKENTEETERGETVTVRFYSCLDGLLEERPCPLGTTLTAEDMPFCEAASGHVCVWEYPHEPLTGETDCRAVAYKTVATAEEFLKISGEGRYMLTDDIDFSDAVCTAGVTGGLLGSFSGTIEGNGRTFSGLTLQGTTKFLFTRLYNACIRNLDFGTVVFEGTQTPLSGKIAAGCALVGEIAGDTLLQNCRADVRYTASANADNPSAGLTLSLQGGSFVDSELRVTSPSDNSSLDHIYAVCLQSQPSVDINGLTVVAAEGIERRKS